MDPEMITAIRSGDGDQIKNLGKEKPHLFTKRSPQGNTVLHIAVRYGNSSVVSEILKFDQDSSLFDRNCKGETPLHLAVVSSNKDVFDTLLNYKDLGKGENGEENILKIPDAEGNLPLHVAVKNNSYYMVGEMLIKDRDLVRFVNKSERSPLSIAVDSRFFSLACLIIEKAPKDFNDKENLIKLLRALTLRNRSYYGYLYEELPWQRHVNDMDEKGRNLLHYSAVAGNDFITEKLLPTNSSLAYERDREGQTPLHLAARNGQLSCLKNLINTCPDATEVLDNKKRNILHTAAEYGQVNIVLYLLQLREVEDLINVGDNDGNTPLHLAAMNVDIRIINILSKNWKVRIRATNKEKLTALQVAEAFEDPKKAFQKHLTIKALKAAHADQALEAEDILENSHFKGICNIDGNSGHKEMAQTLSVMATLIATFTFTAAFTIPGGFISDGPDQGLAALARKTAFQTFVVTDTIAMTSSMTAAIVVFWTFWRRGIGAFMDILPLAIWLIWIGLVSMTIAFVTGLFVVLSKNLTLAIVVCSIGCVLPFIFYVIAPLLLSKSEFAQIDDNLFLFILRMVKMFLEKSWKLIKVFVLRMMLSVFLMIVRCFGFLRPSSVSSLVVMTVLEVMRDSDRLNELS